MHFHYKNASHKFMLPQEISDRIESCEMTLYLAMREGGDPAIVSKLEQELDYWQNVMFHYW